MHGTWVLSHFSCVWLFVTLWTVTHQALLSMGFSRHEYQSGWPCPPSGDLPYPGVEPMSFMSPALAGGFFNTSAIWEAPQSSLSSVQSLSRIRLFAIPWIAARQAPLSITNSWSSLRLTSIESVMPSSHLILCPAPNPSQHQSLFQWVNSLHEVAKVLEFQL